jgi:uncharacterized protein YceH (UPF0502 family)
VVGSLIEKQLTTPQQYPLTMNALLSACNQSSNRDPVVEFDERTVDEALVSLKAAGLARFVHPSHGRSVVRYEQLLGESLGMSEKQLALVGVLLLRGPQTAGELRSRTERMCDFEGIAEVDVELEALSKLAEPPVAKLARQPGQKEQRWVQLLTGWDGAADDATGGGASPLGGPVPARPTAGRPSVMPEATGPRFEVPAAIGPRFGVEAPRSEAPAVAELRSEATELPSEATELLSEATELPSEATELLSEVTELRSELAGLRSEVTELSAEMVGLRDEFERMRRELYD